jgi:hypothetical protein
MSKYDPESYQRNRQSHLERQRRYKSKHKNLVNERQRQYRKETKDQLNIYANKRRNKIREQYDEYMKDKKCSMCEYSDPRSLVWHHTDPSNKKNGVVQLVGKKHGWNTILSEISKCVCLCHNCHNIEHNHSSSKASFISSSRHSLQTK